MLNADKSELVKDELTGLLTRKSLHLALRKFQAENDDRPVTVFAVEISRFGVVNGSVGTGIADKIIATTAKRLQKTFPTAIAMARLHGDHFGIVFDNSVCTNDEALRLLDFSQRPLAIRGEAIVLSVRIGVASSDLIVETPDELVHAAEVALLNSKKTMAKICHFEKNMIEDARTLHHLENDLRISLVTKAAELHQAISNSEFELFYQPIIDIKKRKIHAFEALLRWNHPKRGLVSPAVFIPLAEQIHVMSVLGNWIIRRACADAAIWINQGGQHSDIAVSVNVSPVQFLEFDTLYAALTTAIKETGLSPKQLKLEITESSDFSSSMRKHLKRIKSLGCHLALDDFGTGFSSLAQLVELPLDYVKVDRSLVQELGMPTSEHPERTVKLARSVLNLAESLEVQSIVEGIETDEGLAAVKALGGTLVQGYIFAKPMPAGDVSGFIKQFNREN